jgi:hypothetical protein
LLDFMRSYVFKPDHRIRYLRLFKSDERVFNVTLEVSLPSKERLRRCTVTWVALPYSVEENLQKKRSYL